MATRTQRAPRQAPWPWAVAGALLGAVLALLVFAPAHWLALAVANASGGHVLLADPRGTVWDGSARLVLTGGPGSNDAAALPGRVSWELHPRWNGALAAVRTECCTSRPIDLRVALHAGGLRVQVGDGESEWPASVLAGLGTPWNTLQLDGEVRLATAGAFQ